MPRQVTDLVAVLYLLKNLGDVLGSVDISEMGSSAANREMSTRPSVGCSRAARPSKLKRYAAFMFQAEWQASVLSRSKAYDMTQKNHPSYPNPIIVEALCEIRFRPITKTPQPNFFGPFFERILERYPGMEPIVDNPMLHLSREGEGQKPQLPRQRMRFKHRDRSMFIQLGANLLTFNVLAPYPGWQVMRSELWYAWQHTTDVLPVEAVAQIGLRYINRVNRTTAKEVPGAWFQSTDYIPAGVLNSAPGFLLRLKTHPDAENQIIVTFADQAPEGSRGYGGIIFDIDCMCERELLHPDQPVLMGELDRLHEKVWVIFEAARTDRLEQFMQGVLP